MAKYYGKVGYANLVETEPGLWEEVIEEVAYSGDFIGVLGKFQLSNSVNSDVNVSNKISIMSDPFAEENFFKIRYVEYMGAKWLVTSAEPQRPRLILTIGGLYNGN